MRRILMVLWLVLWCTSADGQNLLPQHWRFHTGDDPAWAKHDFNDTEWDMIKVGETWEAQGFPGYDGFAWYRARVVLPSTLRAKVSRHGGLTLYFSQIDDVDEAYFNGGFIGKTGSFPPTYEGKPGRHRAYTIPASWIQWDRPNTLAVRVYDRDGDGGITGEIPSLSLKGMREMFTMNVCLLGQDHVFPDSDTIAIPVKLENTSDEAIEGIIDLTIGDDTARHVFDRSDEVSIKDKTSKTVTFKMLEVEPAFYTAHVSFTSPFVCATHQFAFAVEPTRVVSPSRPPRDLVEFWGRAKQELAAVAPQFKLVKKPSLCTTYKDVYLVEMRSLGSVLIRGWYSVPKRPGTYPAILHLQEYGAVMQPSRLYPGTDFICFGLNVRGHGNSRDSIDPGFPGFLTCQLSDKELYVYRGAFMDCVRAIDFLCSRDEVDTKRIVVEGERQGGALSIATAALDNKRIRLCAIASPTLSDFRSSVSLAGAAKQELEEYVASHPESSWEDVYRTLAYFDVSNLAPWVNAPVYMFVGLQDERCPPRSSFIMYNKLRTKKQYKIFPYAGQDLPEEYRTQKYQWMKQGLGMIKQTTKASAQ